MKICVIGAGAVGGSFGARLAASGQDVTLVDAWKEHVEAINSQGLIADGVPSPIRVQVAAFQPEMAPAGFDLAFIAADTNNTSDVAKTAARILLPGGVALTVQNGIGNIEKLRDAVGRERVLGGSTMCSFRTVGPGHIEQTHMGPTTMGELEGEPTQRLRELAGIFERAGYQIVLSSDIMRAIWTKFVLNCSINALCATSGLRTGEIARLQPMDRMQDRVMDEAFAVVRAKGLDLGEGELRAKIKAQCWLKYNRPSMLQHVEAGRRTEIDALNGALVREAQALGLAVPYNDALVMLLKGRERAQMRRVQEPNIDYTTLEAAAKDEPKPARA